MVSPRRLSSAEASPGSPPPTNSRKAGVPHILIEKQPRVGGVIETRIAGKAACSNADRIVFSPPNPTALALIKELGLEATCDRLQRSSAHHLHPAPRASWWRCPKA